LIEHAIEHSRAWMDEQIGAIPARTPAEVAAHLDIWRRILEATNFHAGCAVTGVITGAQDTGLLDRAAAAYTAASDALAIKFHKVGVPEAQATRRAALLVIAAEGAVLIARARRSTEPLLLVVEQFKSPEA
jgi:TetR/AcrR family transcriptional regulator, lmrAB and yxaGH operons repressor